MRISVFCGAKVGALPAYREATIELGEALAKAGIDIVYGGASVGLMGVLADAARAHGGEVIGVMPQTLVNRELAHPQLSRLEVVDTLAARKARMAELSDAFIALPGGIGTLEELTEMWTLAQLNLHDKPCALLNVAGYYDDLLRFLDHACAQGLLWPEHRQLLISDHAVAPLLAQINARIAARVAPDAPSR